MTENEDVQLIHALSLTVACFVKKYGTEGKYTFTKEEVNSVLEDGYDSKYNSLNYEDDLTVTVVNDAEEDGIPTA